MSWLKQFKNPSQQTLTVKTLSKAYVRRIDKSTISHDILTGQSGGTVNYIEPDAVDRTIKINYPYNIDPAANNKWSTTGCLYLWASGAISNTTDVTPLTWTKEVSGSTYIYTVTLPANKYLCLTTYNKRTNPTGGVIYWYSGATTNSVSSVETGGWKDLNPHEEGLSGWETGNIYKKSSGSWTT